MGRKREAVKMYDDAAVDGTPPRERAMKRRLILEEVGADHKAIWSWKRQLEKDAAGEKRLSRRRERARGAGRPITMTKEQEQLFDQWIELRCRCNKHHRVSEVHIRLRIKLMFDLKVGEHCVRGFMKRWKWAVHLRTTTKQMTGKDAALTKEKFQQFLAAMFATKHHCFIYSTTATRPASTWTASWSWSLVAILS